MTALPRGLGDAALRDRVAQATATYFTDWSHPTSGMARERSAGAFGYDVADTVTTGGTGFGILAQIVAAERGWRPRAGIADRVWRILDFLDRCDSFRGVFPHFLSGDTGRVIAFLGHLGTHCPHPVQASFTSCTLLRSPEIASN